MATASVGGLVSGLDTSTIISQLMQVEALSQTRLKSRVSTEQGNLTKLQDLNSKLAALTTTAQKLSSSSGWLTGTVTSSSQQVTATAGPAASVGSLSFTVDRLAAAHSLSFAGTAAPTDVVVSGGTTVRLDRLDGSTVDLDTGDGTLAGLVRAVNGSGTGLTAQTITLDDGSQRLRVTATVTGAASDFTLTNLDGSPLLGGAAVTAGQDARLTIGGDTVTSTTNTFSRVVSGLEITLGRDATPGTAVTLEVARDASSAAALAKSFVDQVNAVLSDLDSATAYPTAGTARGTLSGDSALRSVRSQLLSTVYPGNGGTMASIGIQTDRYGKLVFDQTAFTAAYADDPTAATQAFTAAGTTPGAADGFAARMATVAKAASDPYTGVISTSIKSRQDGITRLQSSISAWDQRLELRRSALERQFAALETSLSSLNSQSSWLTSQLSALSSSSSSS